MTPYQSKGLSMAQVDCSAQGDLCAQLGVNSYPTLKLYRDGKDAGNYGSVAFLPLRNMC
jgi:thioredoxin-like negative regulator of GroEL